MKPIIKRFPFKNGEIVLTKTEHKNTLEKDPGYRYDSKKTNDFSQTNPVETNTTIIKRVKKDNGKFIETTEKWVKETFSKIKPKLFEINKKDVNFFDEFAKKQKEAEEKRLERVKQGLESPNRKEMMEIERLEARKKRMDDNEDIRDAMNIFDYDQDEYNNRRVPNFIRTPRGVEIIRDDQLPDKESGLSNFLRPISTKRFNRTPGGVEIIRDDKLPNNVYAEALPVKHNRIPNWWGKDKESGLSVDQRRKLVKSTKVPLKYQIPSNEYDDYDLDDIPSRGRPSRYKWPTHRLPTRNYENLLQEISDDLINFKIPDSSDSEGEGIAKIIARKKLKKEIIKLIHLIS